MKQKPDLLVQPLGTKKVDLLAQPWSTEITSVADTIKSTGNQETLCTMTLLLLINCLIPFKHPSQVETSELTFEQESAFSPGDWPPE